MLRQITKCLTRSYRTITPEDYLFNQRQSAVAIKNRTVDLRPLPNASQGDTDLIDQVLLVGTSKNFKEEVSSSSVQFDSVQSYMVGGRDLVFLMVDPSEYIARQRFLAHKCAMGNVQDYRTDGVQLIDPHKVVTWEESVVNLLNLDMLHNNSLPQGVDYSKGFYGYNYKQLSDEQNHRAITPLLTNSISSHILGNKASQYPLIEKFLYTSLMGRQKVMLGGMPQTNYRMILGGGLSIHEVRDMFRMVVLKNKQLNNPFKVKEAAENFMPHIFNLPKDLYLTAILKQAFQACSMMVAVVGMQHWRPMQEYWVGPPHGINMTQATRIPEGFEGETVEDLIEKQAILDVLLESRTWSAPYLSNPFPYLFEDITKIPQEELQNYKQMFLLHYKKYKAFLQKQTKQIQAPSQKMLLERMQEMKTMKQGMGGHQLKHVKGKMDMKLKKGFMGMY